MRVLTFDSHHGNRCPCVVQLISLQPYNSLLQKDRANSAEIKKVQSKNTLDDTIEEKHSMTFSHSSTRSRSSKTLYDKVHLAFHTRRLAKHVCSVSFTQPLTVHNALFANSCWSDSQAMKPRPSSLSTSEKYLLDVSERFRFMSMKRK